MRRSAAAILGVAIGTFVGAAFFRCRTAHAERADLYFEDGSMLSLTEGSPEAAAVLPIARRILDAARS